MLCPLDGVTLVFPFCDVVGKLSGKHIVKCKKRIK